MSRETTPAPDNSCSDGTRSPETCILSHATAGSGAMPPGCNPLQDGAAVQHAAVQHAAVQHTAAAAPGTATREPGFSPQPEDVPHGQRLEDFSLILILNRGEWPDAKLVLKACCKGESAIFAIKIIVNSLGRELYGGELTFSSWQTAEFCQPQPFCVHSMYTFFRQGRTTFPHLHVLRTIPHD